MSETIVIIGAGASGMLAALTAKEEADRRVILLERQQRIGRKLLSTGNGRCNLTNTGAALSNYHGEQPEFAKYALERFSPQDTLDYFAALGLMTVEEYGGRVYPLSNSANSVLDVLRFAIERAGIELHCACPVKTVRRQGNRFAVVTEEESFAADKLIVACGGAAGAKLGGVSDGYALLGSLGHKRTSIYPALVQLTTEPDYPRALKGVRADAALTLLSGERVLARSAGELQFTEKGVSGPAVFDISRAAAKGGEGLKLSIDFFRTMDDNVLIGWLLRRRASLPDQLCAELFTGMLHNRLGRMLVKYCGFNPNAPLSSLCDSDLRHAAKGGKDFVLPVRGTEGFDSAQVTAGGMKTAQFDPKTLESRLVPGLYACGEVLDIDGDCGGYNLQWAWASGRLAGRFGK